MINNYLESAFKQGKLYNSLLIDSGNTEITLKNLTIFIESNLLIEEVPLGNHPDYRLVAKDDTTTKNISVEQIRELQQFFHKTPSISKYRVAVIYQADLMNINAASSCLKLLEDTPKNAFIFLITARAAGIISTIRSRCAKINEKKLQNCLADSKIYGKITTYIANGLTPEVKLNIIEEFANKNKELWKDFAYSILCLINKLAKKSINMNIELSISEEKIFKQLPDTSVEYLLTKFFDIKRIINNTIDYDLRLQPSIIILMEKLIPTKV